MKTKYLKENDESEQEEVTPISGEEKIRNMVHKAMEKLESKKAINNKNHLTLKQTKQTKMKLHIMEQVDGHGLKNYHKILCRIQKI